MVLLPATCVSHQSHGFSLINRQVEILQHRFIRFVIKRHVLHSDVFGDRAGINRIRLVDNFRYGIHQGKSPVPPMPESSAWKPRLWPSVVQATA